MPVKTRDKLIQSYERCQGAYDRVLYHLSVMRNTYGEQAPQHRDAIEQIGIATMQVKELLKDFRYKHM